MQHGNDGFQRTGSRPPGIGNTLDPKDETTPGSTSRQSGSSLTTLPEETSLPTSDRHGELGFSNQPSLAELLRKGDSDLIELAAEALLKSHVECSHAPIFTDDPYTTCRDRRIGANMTAGGDKDAGRKLLSDAFAPAHRSDVLRALLRCRASVVASATDDDSVELTMEVFADELAERPADAVIGALRDWPRGNRYWPSLVELLDCVDRRCAVRLAMARALGLVSH